MANEGRVVQVNVSRGGVPKTPVPEARVSELGLDGDKVAHPRIHGGPDRAVCLYSLERIEALRKEGHAIFPGAIGENLTLSGLDWDRVAPGARIEAGACLLEITKYTTPCSTTSPYVSGDQKRYHQDHNPGWSRVYARVLRPGTVRPGDAARLVLDATYNSTTSPRRSNTDEGL
jgi:MOSC domain-containing protein YiiM